MAVNSTDPTTGAPQFSENAAPELGVDLTAVGSYAADVGNRIVRANLAGLEAYPHKRPGLAGHALDTGQDYLHGDTGWVPTLNDSGWIAVTFQNGWVNAAVGEEVEIRKLNGVVYMKGRPALGTAGAAFTLPPGWRPKSVVRDNPLSGAGTSTTPVVVNTGGTVVLVSGAQPYLAAIAPFPADG